MVVRVFVYQYSLNHTNIFFQWCQNLGLFSELVHRFNNYKTLEGQSVGTFKMSKWWPFRSIFDSIICKVFCI